MLLLAAAMLGLLAFFEPCTIATHTLFSARLHQAGNTKRLHTLIQLWLARTLLVSSILIIAVVFLPVPEWGRYTPSIILSVMAMIYVVSRLTYLPIPHLEFFKLVPGSRNLPQSIQLGLTVPACTIPLLVTLTGAAITINSVWIALAVGVLYAGFFTLPAVYAVIKGIHEPEKELLAKAANGTTYLTAVLLFAIALFLVLAQIEINVPILKAALSEASLLGIGIGFLAGFLFSFNPVSFASIPVVLAYVTKAHEERRALLLGSAFVAGMILTHVFLGVAAAMGGGWVQGVLGRGWGLFLGPLLIILGLMWPGWIKIRFPWFSMRAKKVTGVWGAFALGIPFSIAVCPFCTPALIVTLAASAAIGSVWFGFLLLLAFAVGRSIPIILGAWSMGWLESLKVLSRYQRPLEIGAGIVLILTGFYMLNEYFLIVGY